MSDIIQIQEQPNITISIVGGAGPTFSTSEGVYIPDWGVITNKPDFDSLYYPLSNPSGFITGAGDWATYSQLSDTGAFLVSLNSSTSGALRLSISGLQSQTGSYYPRTNPSGYVTGSVVRPNTYTLYDASTSLSLDWNVEQLYSDGFLAADWRSRTLNDSLGSTSLDWTNRSFFGTWTLDTQATGNNDVVNLVALVDYAYPRSNPSGYVTGVDTTLFLSRSETGAFYSSLNPSGYINSGALSSYATQGYVNSASGALRTDILSIQGATGNFYLSSNPSGYVTGSVVRPSETGSFITLGQTGLFYSSSNPSGYVTGSVIRPSETGVFYANSNPSGYITSAALTPYATQSYVNSASGVLRTDISQIQGVTGDFYLTSNPSGFITGQVVRPPETGNFITTAQTGQFYPASNPSGYITGLNTGIFVTTSQTGQFYAASNPSSYITAAALSPYATQSYVTGVSGALRADITIIQSVTGGFYLNSNPSGYVTGSVVRPTETGAFLTLSSLSTYATQAYVNNVSGVLRTDISSLQSATGQYYLTSNPSGFISSAQTGAFYPSYNPSGYVTGLVVRPSETGQFYSSSNPNGYITGFDSGLYVLASQTGGYSSLFYPLSTNPSGYVTGQVIRASDTGQFYPASNPSGFITGVNLTSYVLKSETGLYTGAFYPLQANPSGYVTGSVVRPADTGVFITANETGSLTGSFYPLSSNPSLYVTGSVVRPADTGSFATTGWVNSEYYPRSNPSGYSAGGGGLSQQIAMSIASLRI